MPTNRRAAERFIVGARLVVPKAAMSWQNLVRSLVCLRNGMLRIEIEVNALFIR
jgi:hypothetical protein